MLKVAVYNTDGEKVETLRVNEAVFGGRVNTSLLKQAVVAYAASRRQGSAANRGRSEKTGSTRKLFRQKGTGFARRGNLRTNIMRGGGVAFGKKHRDFGKTLPRRMRKAALASAILAKLLGEDLLVVDGLGFDGPRTKDMAGILRNLRINRSCILALAERDRNIYLSARNIPDLTVRTTEELNAYDVATRQKMRVTADAMKVLIGQEGQE